MNRLKELRKEKKITQDELAKKVKIPLRTYQRLENGETQIKPDKAQVLADHFGVSVGYLLGYSEYRDSQEASSQLHKQDPNDPYILVKARISAILGDNMLEELERQYVTGSYDDPDFSILISFLSAVNALLYTPEEKMLLNYGILSKADKKIINNLVAEMAEKVKNPPKKEKTWEF